jgi:Ca2+:H+ antiporter
LNLPPDFSSLATIGLTIPAVGVATYALGKELTLGLSARAACFCS